MSRFSKAEAEARGWVFVHEDEGQSVEISDPQHGNANLEARLPRYRAERNFNGKLINEEADSLGLLLERIHSFEQLQERKQLRPEPPRIDPEAVPVDPKTGLPIRSVQVAGGERLIEAEFAADGEEARAASQKLARDGEDERVAEPEIETKTVVYDNADSLDTPGQSAGGTLTVRADDDVPSEHPTAEASRARDARAAELENARVVAGLGASSSASLIESARVEEDEEPEPENDPEE